MVRINLLPNAKKDAASGGGAGSTQLWLGGYLALAVFALIVAGVQYYLASTHLEELQERNTAMQARITELRAQSAGLEEARALLAESQALEETVNELNRARTGPARVMIELGNILSVDKGPTYDEEDLLEQRRRNPLAGFNQSWDVRRLWLTSFVEESRSVRIAGRGRTNEDVAEFIRRLTLSELFSNVALQRTSATTEDDLELISFEITGQINY